MSGHDISSAAKKSRLHEDIDWFESEAEDFSAEECEEDNESEKEIQQSESEYENESLLAWKGRLSFRQYIPSKRSRFGIKLFALCDPVSGYVHKLSVYIGDEREQAEGTDNDKPPSLHNFSAHTGPNFTPPADTLPVEYFDYFFLPVDQGRSSLWDFIAAETNKYFEYTKAKVGVLQALSKLNLWENATVQRLRAFIGLCLNKGLWKALNINAYFDGKHHSQNDPAFRETMKQDAFNLMLRFLHVSDSHNEPPRSSTSYDPQYKYRKVLEHLTARWQQGYDLFKAISIDETIVGFKGRHCLGDYIRIKNITSGARRNTILPTQRPENHSGKNNHLVVDNYYTSQVLCEEMLKKQIYVTGTVRKGRRGLPQGINAKMTTKGEMKVMRSGQMMALSWVDRKQVRMLSTHASAKTCEKTLWNGQVKTLPTVVVEYNDGMGGIDVADQMTDAYAAERRTMKCWKKIFFHLLDKTMTNAYIMYKLKPNIAKQMGHYNFIVEVIKGLLGDYQEA
ncbi:piggyBac transposable element-derived protein 4-like [Watersipora subatra]|uniref:piggyBac transposable element-derived protein 4-like n=1 Tax=Watersipora subatra TaxID=2589382 RepID=UPI00355BAC37